MPSTSTATNPLGINIEFNEELHLYKSNVNNKEIIYTSVTELVSKYFKPFDAIKIAEKVAKKRNVTKEVIISEWDKTRTDAINYGTRIHQVAEDVLTGAPVRFFPENNKESTTFNLVTNAATQLKEKFEIVGVEKIVFDHRLKLAGTIDLLLKHNDTYLIVDWKTNKELNDENKYYEFGLGPISELADTAINHYALQLSIYEYILKNVEYIPKNSVVKRVLMHVTPFGINHILVDNLEKFVKDIIIDYLLTTLN